MHRLESFLENEVHKILWDFDIKLHHLISTRRQARVVIKKKSTYQLADITVLIDNRYWLKVKEREKLNNYLDFAKELKKVMEHEDDSEVKHSWCSWNNLEELEKEIEETKYPSQNWDNSERSIANIG